MSRPTEICADARDLISMHSPVAIAVLCIAVILFPAVAGDTCSTVENTHALSRSMFSSRNICIDNLKAKNGAGPACGANEWRLADMNAKMLTFLAVRLKGVNSIVTVSIPKKFLDPVRNIQLRPDRRTNEMENSWTSTVVYEKNIERHIELFWLAADARGASDGSESAICRVYLGEDNSRSLEGKKSKRGPPDKIGEHRQRDSSGTSGDYGGNLNSPIFVRSIVYVASLCGGWLCLFLGWKYFDYQGGSFGASLISAFSVLLMCGGTILFLFTLWRVGWGWWL